MNSDKHKQDASEENLKKPIWQSRQGSLALCSNLAFIYFLHLTLYLLIEMKYTNETQR